MYNSIELRTLSLRKLLREYEITIVGMKYGSNLFGEPYSHEKSTGYLVAIEKEIERRTNPKFNDVQGEDIFKSN